MKYLPKFHLYPPKGWLNDPNGLCQLNGVHHTFFQYSPDNPRGADKYWGHYETKDFVNYTYTGILLSPDTRADRNGVFSGSALIEDETMHLFYTGNVEEGDGELIYEGREGNTIHVTTKDGVIASDKEVLLWEKDYPERLSCHVRDPKVWKENDKYYMVLGARTNADEGLVMLYKSSDMHLWNFVRYIEPDYKFAFMWECPDLFELAGKRFLSLSPQGLEASEFKFQNVHQTGYFMDNRLKEATDEKNDTLYVAPESFVEWDMGFDFYAPQTYVDESGRRILIGWMGVPGPEYDNDPSIEAGWQHMLSVPRELSLAADGRIKQWPVKEIDGLRGEMLWSKSFGNICDNSLPEIYELLITGINPCDLTLLMDDSLEIYYDAEEGIIIFSYVGNGYGRTERRLKLRSCESLEDMRILVDNCTVEIFINGGLYCFSTKLFYGALRERKLNITGNFGNVKCIELKSLKITFDKDE